MNDTNLPARVVLGDTVLYQSLKDELVLLNISNQRYYGLDDVGARMWELLLEMSDVAAVRERLIVDYDVDSATVQRDLERLIQELLAAGLLKAA